MTSLLLALAVSERICHERGRDRPVRRAARALRSLLVIATDAGANGALRGAVMRASCLGSRTVYAVASEIGELFVTRPLIRP